MKNSDGFINVPLSIENVDRYYHRTSILNAIEENLSLLCGRLLDAGCGKMPYKDYILNHSRVEQYVGLDIETALDYSDTIASYVTWNGETMPFNDKSFDCVFATEVMEHIPKPTIYLKELYRVLKPGGTFFFTVPFLWPLHETPHDEYRYTPYALERILREVGFSEVAQEPLGGWHASMAQMLGLWWKRSGFSHRKKAVLKYFLLPIYRQLIKMDQKEIGEGKMITGIAGTARKNSN